MFSPAARAQPAHSYTAQWHLRSVPRQCSTCPHDTSYPCHDLYGVSITSTSSHAEPFGCPMRARRFSMTAPGACANGFARRYDATVDYGSVRRPGPLAATTPWRTSTVRSALTESPIRALRRPHSASLGLLKRVRERFCRMTFAKNVPSSTPASAAAISVSEPAASAVVVRRVCQRGINPAARNSKSRSRFRVGAPAAQVSAAAAAAHAPATG